MSNQGSAGTPKRERLRALFPLLSRSRSHSPSASISSVTNITSALASTSLSPPPSTASQSTTSTQLPAVVLSQQTNVSTAPSPSFTASIGPGNVDIFAQAFGKLSASDRDTLQPLINPTNSDIGQAIAASLSAAKQKQREFQSKRWVFTFAGRSLTLKEEMDKIVQWLDRFKSVGDIVVNADPLHAGLPWAGIRLLLELAVSDHKQLESLLVGCETTLYIINRLEVYMDFLRQLPTCSAKTNFEVALIDMYAQLLAFLAKAIHVYQQSTVQRVSTSFWHEREVTAFEQNCDRLANNLEIEASNCDRMLSGHDRERLQQLHQALYQALLDFQRIRSVQTSLDRIERKIDRSRLRVVESALFNAYNQTHNACHKATRVDLLQLIYNWAQQPTSKSIFWLNGAAGSGKSTIAWTVAKYLIDQSSYGVIDMGGSFFFKRGEGDRGRAECLFPTIAYQLAMKLDGLDILVTQAIDADPSICSKSLSEQFKKLIREPLQKLATDSGRPTYIIVIDALDECEDEDIATVLLLWSELPNLTNVSLRLFLTSRPDLPVLYGFDEISLTAHLDVDLQQETRLTTRNDLTLFLQDNFNHMRDKYNRRPLLGLSLDPGWPGEAVINELVEMAYPLFIVAKTVCLFVGDLRWDPTERLTSILGSRKIGQLSQMAQCYMPVLQHLTQPVSDSEDRDLLCSEFRLIVGAIITLAEPLSTESLGVLLDVPVGSVARKLEPLRSVLEIPPDLTTPIRPLHLSFAEFLTSEELRNEPFGIDNQTTHAMLMQQCLKLLSDPGPNSLHEDLCGLRQPGQLRKELAPGTVEKRISPAMNYACQYWPHHVLLSGIKVQDESEVHIFLKAHFLHWLEALSLLDRLADAIEHVAKLQSNVSSASSTTISSFLEDARRFVLSFRAIGDKAPLQLYCSATMFSPQTSVVREICPNVPAWISQRPQTLGTWGSELQKLEGHTDAVQLVTFSPDGSLIATAAIDESIRLWSTTTGQEVQRFLLKNTVLHHFARRSGGRVLKWIAFSKDTSLLAVISESTEIQRTSEAETSESHLQMWNISSGREAQQAETLPGKYSAATFTSNGVLVACRPERETIVLVNMTTGQELQRYNLPRLAHQEHDTDIEQYQVIATAFSPDHSLLASSYVTLCNNTYVKPFAIQVWTTNTSQRLLQTFKTGARSLAISPDNLLLATAEIEHYNSESGLWERLIRIWSLETGKIVSRLSVRDIVPDGSLTFSPNGLLLCVGLHGGDLWVSHFNTDQGLWPLAGHTQEVTNLVFSPDSTIVASVSNDQTVRLWDVGLWDVGGTNEVILHEGTAHTLKFGSLAFSSDGALLASASSDGGLQIWCVSSGQILKKVLGHTPDVNDIAFSPDCLWMASISGDGMVQLWNLEREEHVPQIYAGRIDAFNVVGIGEIDGMLKALTRLSFSPNGNLVASGLLERDGVTIRVWSVGKPEALMIVKSTQIWWMENLAWTSDSTAFDIGYGLYIPINPAPASEETAVLALEDIMLEKGGDGAQPTLDVDPDNEADHKRSIMLKQHWIECHGERLLWLPQEYRDATKAQHGNTFAFGMPNARVEFLKIEPPHS